MTTSQCDFSAVMGNIPEMMQPVRCVYVAGHGGNHLCPLDNDDHSDEIRLRVKQDRLEAAEATGRAAVRALDEICSAVRWPEIASVYPRWASRVDAVLATDTAKRWLAESDATRVGADADEGRDD